MRKILLFILVFLSIENIFCQSNDYVFGRLTQSDIDLNEVSFDKDAEAVIIYDKGESYFANEDDYFYIYFRRTTKIKILEEAGIIYAEFEIPFYREGNIFEKIYDLQGITHNFIDGRDVSTVFDIKNAYDVTLNDSWTLKKFALPDVRPGSVLEVTYKIRSQYKFNLQDWYFQNYIPTLHSEYVIRSIPFYEYTFILQGDNKFDYQYSEEDPRSEAVFGRAHYKEMVTTLIQKNVPAFKDEAFLTSPDHYRMKLDFQLSKVTQPDGAETTIITTWPELTERLIKHDNFGKYISKSAKYANKELNLDRIAHLPEIERFNTLTTYVKANYNWDKKTSKYCYKSLKDFVNEKHGNVANINLFLTGLLRAAGLDATPVILSTRSHGKVYYKYPFDSFLNYVIVMVKIGDDIILTDATEIMAKNSMIPPRCLNGKGLLVDKTSEEWVNLTYKYPARLKTTFNIDFNEDQSETRIIVDEDAYEYFALQKRKQFYGTKDEVKEKLGINESINVEEITEIENLDKPEEAFHARYILSQKTFKANNKIYITPFLKDTISQNPFKLQSRTFPIDMEFPKIINLTSIIAIPHGYIVEYLPPFKTFDNKLITINYNAVKDEDKVIINYSYYFKKDIYPASDYLKLKVYYDDLVRLSNEKLVFIKEEGE